jgi:adenylate cyclase
LYVFFGAPEKSNDTDNAVRCVKMAIEMQLKMRALNAKWFDKGVEEQLTIRCGINTGMATVGGYGSSERKEYTAMGMQVNIAARLEQACLPNNILISHTTWALVKDRISCISMDPITVKGYHRPIRIYQVDIQDQTRISQHDSVEKAF